MTSRSEDNATYQGDNPLFNQYSPVIKRSTWSDKRSDEQKHRGRVRHAIEDLEDQRRLKQETDWL